MAEMKYKDGKSDEVRKISCVIINLRVSLRKDWNSVLAPSSAIDRG